MTKKLSLAALALVSACYLTACDDDSSSVIAPVDETDSSASVASSESKADPESSASEEAKSSAEAAPESSSGTSSEDKTDPESSPSGEIPAVEVSCDIDKKSDTWSFTAKTEYEGMPVIGEGKTEFKGESVSTFFKISLETGSKFACEALISKLGSDDDSYFEIEGDDFKFDNACDDNGVFSMTMGSTGAINDVDIGEIDENNQADYGIEERKEELYQSMVRTCKSLQEGDVSEFLPMLPR